MVLSSVFKFRLNIESHAKCDEDEGITCSKCGKLQTLVSLISNKLKIFKRFNQQRNN